MGLFCGGVGLVDVRMVVRGGGMVRGRDGCGGTRGGREDDERGWTDDALLMLCTMLFTLEHDSSADPGKL